MASTSSLFRQIYFKITGYSFTHMGRLFLRLFVGLMLAQFGIRQLHVSPDASCLSSNLPVMACGLSEWLVIIVEIICSFFIMIGLFTRLMIIPPFILMIVSCHQIFTQYGFTSYFSIYLMALPFLFMGIYMFLILVGPGKISLDYFYSLYLINRHQDKEEDLEEV